MDGGLPVGKRCAVGGGNLGSFQIVEICRTISFPKPQCAGEGGRGNLEK